MNATGVRARTTVPLADMRVAGGLLLFAAAVLPLAPASAGIPCPLHTLTGIPCPLCGMTRSVTAAVHLRLGDAFAYNPAGLVAVAVAVAVLLLRRIDAVAVPVWVAPVALGLLWAWQLLRFPAT